MSEFFIVDVFAERRYAGNQLAVVVDAASIASDEMQAIAGEFGFSETTFVTGESDGGYDVRIFTPTAELPFAGHPTLGTATVLRHSKGGDRVTLNLGVGPVPVSFEPGGAGEEAWMSPPSPTLGAEHPAEWASELLGLRPSDIDSSFPVQQAAVGIEFLMVPVRDLAALRRAAYDAAVRARLAVEGVHVTGVYAFCREAYTDGRHIACRMLWEANGAREDPATGSACVCLGGYALAHGYLGGAPIDAWVEQGHEVGRPSLLHLRAQLEGGEARVRVGGSSVIVAQGRLL